MRFLLPTLLLSLAAVSGCSQEDICDLVGDRFVGHFSGDAEGDLTIEIVDTASDGAPLLDVTISDESFVGIGEGTVSCEDGAFVVELVDADGIPTGSLEGSLVDHQGTWSLTDGRVGTWTVTPE